MTLQFPYIDHPYKNAMQLITSEMLPSLYSILHCAEEFEDCDHKIVSGTCSNS